MERTKCVRVQAGIRVCELSVYVVYVPGLFLKLIVIVMVIVLLARPLDLHSSGAVLRLSHTIPCPP